MTYSHDNKPTIISQNCLGGVLYKDFGVQFLSPTIDLGIYGEDFLKFVENLHYYLSITPEPLSEKGHSPFSDKFIYPLVTIDDITLHCGHYDSCAEAIECWERRKLRVNYDRIYVLANSWDMMSDPVLIERLCQSPYNTVCFTFEHYDFDGCIQLQGDEWQKKRNGVVTPGLLDYVPGTTKRYYEGQYDFRPWFAPGL